VLHLSMLLQGWSELGGCMKSKPANPGRACARAGFGAKSTRLWGRPSAPRMAALEAIRWRRGPPASLQLLDQRLLPLQTVFADIDGPEAAWKAIKARCCTGCPSSLLSACCKNGAMPRAQIIVGKHEFCSPYFNARGLTVVCRQDMAVRGAPAIAIAAALALAADLVNAGGGKQFASAADVAHHVKEQMAYLVTRCAACRVLQARASLPVRFLTLQD